MLTMIAQTAGQLFNMVGLLVVVFGAFMLIPGIFGGRPGPFIKGFALILFGCWIAGIGHGPII